MQTIIAEIPLQLIAEVDKYETVLLRCQSPNSHVTSSPVSPSLAAPRRNAPRNSPYTPPAMGYTKGLWISLSWRHNVMNFMWIVGPPGLKPDDAMRRPVCVLMLQEHSLCWYSATN